MFYVIKEVIQPHLPVTGFASNLTATLFIKVRTGVTSALRLYDLAPLAKSWLELVKTKPHQDSTRMA